MVKIIVKGKPKSKQRPFFTTKGGKPRAFTKKSTASFENLIKMKAQEKIEYPLKGSLYLSIKFYLPRPKSKIWKTKPMPAYNHTKRPDLDNLTKAVLDGLNNVAFKDDAQISVMHLEKYYHAGDKGARTEIEIKELSTTPSVREGLVP